MAIRKRTKPAGQIVPLNELKYPEFIRLSAKGNLVPVYREIRGDTETPVSAFLKLRSPAHAFLLESVEGGERWGRYSFLGDRPRLLVRQQAEVTTIEEEGRSRTHEGLMGPSVGSSPVCHSDTVPIQTFPKRNGC